MIDVEIINLYWNRDPAAIEQTEHKYGSYCYSIAYGILNDKEDAKECVNDTWFRIWNAIPSERPYKFRLFLGKVTRNLALDKYRKNNAQKRGGADRPLVLTELDECIPSSILVEETITDIELSQLINKFLHSLPHQACNIFLYRYWYNYSLAEIGGLFSVNENRIKASLFRSRKKLKTYLEQEEVYL